MNDTTELPDAIRLPLHRLWADAGYLIGRARQETDPERFVTIIKSRCEEIEAAYRADRAERAAPIDMVLFCPNCGKQHVDAPEPDLGPSKDGSGDMPLWSNPPHRSHLCHDCCFLCWEALGEDVTVEHLVPVSQGGTNHIGNKVLAHAECNQKMGHLSVMEKIRMREAIRPAVGQRKSA